MQDQIKTKCLDCGNELEFPKNTQIGEIIECKNCGAEMELLSLEPLQLEILEEEK